jgi:hypothetical protein
VSFFLKLLNSIKIYLRFFSTFDQNRSHLLPLYADISVFSLSVNPFPSETSTVRNADRNFDAWWSDNRNLDKLKQTGPLFFFKKNIL